MANSVALPNFTSILNPTPSDSVIESLRKQIITIMEPLVSAATSSITASATVNYAKPVILVNAASGAVTVTLPKAPDAKDFAFFIKKTDSSANQVIVTPVSGATIDGSATKTIFTQYSCITIVSDGTNWFIIG